MIEQDSLDCLLQEIPELRRLYEALECKICRELIKGPVTLPCGHSFCSFCIRRQLEYSSNNHNPTNCPQCRAPCVPSQFLPIPALRDAATALDSLPAALQRYVSQAHQLPIAAPSPVTNAEEVEDALQQPQDLARGAVHGPSTSTPGAPCMGTSRLHNHRHPQHDSIQHSENRKHPPAPMAIVKDEHGSDDIIESSTDDPDVTDDDYDSDYAPEASPEPAAKRQKVQHADEEFMTKPECNSLPSKPTAQLAAARPSFPNNYVECPVCGGSFPTDYVNTHLDKCLDKAQPQPSAQQQHQHQHRAPTPPLAQHSSAAASVHHAPHTSHATAPMQLPAQPPQPPAGPSSSASTQITVPKSLVFRLMKDKEVKQKLIDLGLPTNGKRQDWIDLYQRYRTFLQSKVDEGSHKTQLQLKRLFLEQQQQQAAARNTSSRVPSASSYLHSDLIADLKRRDLAAAAKAAAAAAGGKTAGAAGSRDDNISGQQHQQHQQQQLPLHIAASSVRNGPPLPNSAVAATVPQQSAELAPDVADSKEPSNVLGVGHASLPGANARRGYTCTHPASIGRLDLPRLHSNGQVAVDVVDLVD